MPVAGFAVVSFVILSACAARVDLLESVVGRAAISLAVALSRSSIFFALVWSVMSEVRVDSNAVAV